MKERESQESVSRKKGERVGSERKGEIDLGRTSMGEKV